MWQISTAVTRQVATQLSSDLHPNMFILLVGGPGCGKSQAISATREIFIAATSINTIPSSITRAGLQDYMLENLQERKKPDGSLLLSNECVALSEEMQGILPEHDIGHLTLYNELYDVRSLYRARTRGHGQIDLQAPYCSIITGAQPAFLGTTLPEQAWGMGFMSRSIMVFDQARERSDAFDRAGLNRALQTKLILELREISKLYGYFTWDENARALYRSWWVTRGGPPVPQAKRLAMGYNSRRDLHFFKLAMTFSLSRSSSLIVTQEDVKRAIVLLLKTEERMKHIFTEMSNTGAMVAIQDVLDLIRQAAADDQAVPESALINILMQKFQATQIHAIIDNLLKSGMIEVKSGSLINAQGFREFVPGRKLQLL